jgi:hypothetical protein
MANEISLNGRISFSKSSSSGGLSCDVFPTFAGSKFTRGRQAIGTSEEAIQLGEATGGGGWFFAVNRDGTNSIHIRQASGAANFCTLGPGEFCSFRFSTATTAPYAISSASTPELEYIVLVA